ncbi:MarR family winged helix-turn-helix transcriptional regulator [Streptacidiphilus jiangxiensis]|uniref:DNA-binding transcriptional regulator, MarR family n=1 Tax=Streptacidiphilus jiangxiensis TaxID=235985 RepID=A0A1H7WUE9_STRJI|nr:MarR family transcriptional regulator [Streptacidiphilus jiangxiensis]SEM25041.1 DNA-binding transcriptional regulator, MarR family [Streptacidiphilus jiangxiensis]
MDYYLSLRGNSGVSTDIPDPSAELAELLPAIQRLVRRRLRTGLAQPRLRGAQIELLRLVAARPGLRVSEAAQELFLADNSVSTLVNQLTKAGLLRRETDPTDGRAARLHAQPEALARLADWDARRGALFADQLGRLDAADHEALAGALPALRRLAEGLREEAAS